MSQYRRTESASERIARIEREWEERQYQDAVRDAAATRHMLAAMDAVDALAKRAAGGSR